MKMFSKISCVAAMALALVACAPDDQGANDQASDPEALEVAQMKQAVLGGYCNTHPVECAEWCEEHEVACAAICNHFPNIPLCDDDEPMCLAIGQTCLDEEENPGAPTCCNPETAGCFRGQCAERTFCEPGGLPPGAPCTIGVDVCCPSSGNGGFDPPNVCEPGEETPPGQGTCNPPA